jgi:hypothetical protein
MEEKSPDWSRVLTGIVEKLRLGSVLDPIIAVLMAVLVAAVLAMFIAPGSWLALGFFILVCVVVGVVLVAFAYFALKDPDKLRSSEHEIRKLEIATGMGQKDRELPEAAIEMLPVSTSTDVPPIGPPASKSKKRGGGKG